MTVTADSCVSGAATVADDNFWPPGFRFHPTDEELVLYYLKRKICKKKLKLDIVRVLDVYKWDPEDLPGQSILKTGDRQWFFFSPRDRKYPNGARSNRATSQGYWKATGKDRIIVCNSRNVGLKKTLVFYRGRAPTGARTDWVMHEYTMDEEELKRCPVVHDYYALYKVYKKSGPGPKNGEQYGAPFKEEDWVDDEFPCANGTVTPEIPVKQHNEASVAVSGELEPPLSEEIIKQVADEPALLQPQNNDFTCVPPQVVCEDEAQSALVDPSSREVVISEPVAELTTSGQRYTQHTNFDFNQSATSKLQLQEAHEVTSTPKYEQTLQLREEDFLEIDDLMGPEPTFSCIDQPARNLQFDDFDGLSELDLYHDAAMFLHDIGPVDQKAVPHSYMNSIGDNMVNQVDYQLQPNLITNQAGYQLQPHLVANQVDYQLQPHLVANQVDYLLLPESFGANQMNNQLWVPNQRSNTPVSSESHHGYLSQPTPGVVCGSTNNSTGANSNQGGKEDDGDNGWFSSALWSFVESIPTTPASASENPLVNKAFERMSSFSRVRMNIRNNNVDTGIGAANVRRAGKNRGFIFFSIIGALCAILWVLVGSVRVWGRSISS